MININKIYYIQNHEKWNPNINFDYKIEIKQKITIFAKREEEEKSQFQRQSQQRCDGFEPIWWLVWWLVWEGGSRLDFGLLANPLTDWVLAEAD